MERVYEKCNELINLEEKIKNNQKDALIKFWQEVSKKGTPLVQKYNNSSDYDLVTILYRENKKLQNVVLIPPVGMRNLQNCIMKKISNSDIWYIAYKVKNNMSFTYQFSENDPLDKDWKRRWRNVKGDKYNSKSILHYDKEINKKRQVPYVSLRNAKKKQFIIDKAINKGKIVNCIIKSDILGDERKINIYLPYGYNKTSKPYGLLLLSDGKEYINILNAKNILDNLLYQNKIQPIVAVFIESTKERGNELSCNSKYADFVGKEVFNYMVQNYNISIKPKDNAVAGYSLGGLFASYFALKYSSIIGNILSQSGSYWYKEDGYEGNSWIADQYRNINKLSLKFYINVGLLEPKASMIDTNISFSKTLTSLGYKVKFDYFGSGHDYLYWDETLAEGLIYLLNNND